MNSIVYFSHIQRDSFGYYFFIILDGLDLDLDGQKSSEHGVNRTIFKYINKGMYKRYDVTHPRKRQIYKFYEISLLC